MERKIIQIAFKTYEDTEIDATLFALCDDGTIWVESINDEWRFYMMDPVSQKPIEELMRNE